MKRRTLLMSSSIIPAAFAADALATPSAQDSQLSKMDPDFSAIEDYFLKKEMPKAGEMSVKNRTMITLAALTTIIAANAARTNFLNFILRSSPFVKYKFMSASCLIRTYPNKGM